MTGAKFPFVLSRLGKAKIKLEQFGTGREYQLKYLIVLVEHDILMLKFLNDFIGSSKLQVNNLKRPLTPPAWITFNNIFKLELMKRKGKVFTTVIYYRLLQKSRFFSGLNSRKSITTKDCIFAYHECTSMFAAKVRNCSKSSELFLTLRKSPLR